MFWSIFAMVRIRTVDIEVDINVYNSVDGWFIQYLAVYNN